MKFKVLIFSLLLFQSFNAYSQDDDKDHSVFPAGLVGTWVKNGKTFTIDAKGNVLGTKDSSQKDAQFDIKLGSILRGMEAGNIQYGPSLWLQPEGIEYLFSPRGIHSTKEELQRPYTITKLILSKDGQLTITAREPYDLPVTFTRTDVKEAALKKKLCGKWNLQERMPEGCFSTATRAEDIPELEKKEDGKRFVVNPKTVEITSDGRCRVNGVVDVPLFLNVLTDEIQMPIEVQADSSGTLKATKLEGFGLSFVKSPKAGEALCLSKREPIVAFDENGRPEVLPHNIEHYYHQKPTKADPAK